MPELIPFVALPFDQVLKPDCFYSVDLFSITLQDGVFSESSRFWGANSDTSLC